MKEYNVTHAADVFDGWCVREAGLPRVLRRKRTPAYRRYVNACARGRDSSLGEKETRWHGAACVGHLATAIGIADEYRNAITQKAWMEPRTACGGLMEQRSSPPASVFGAPH